MIMDSNYSWNQPEHNGPAQKIWSKVHNDTLREKIFNQSQQGMQNFQNGQNDVPIYSTFSQNIRDSWPNTPIKIDDYEKYRENEKLESKTNDYLPQLLQLIKKKRDYNKGSTYGYDLQIQNGMISTRTADLYPWIVEKKIYVKNINGLHQEVLDFYKYIMPSKEEQLMRQGVIARLKDVVCREWLDAEVDVFGSFKTELHLPTSDIDVVIFGKWENPLWKLSDIIKRSGIASDCKVLDKATVPIVKMTDKESDVRIDISFNMNNGIKSADLIKSYIKQYPQLPQLVLLLKQYLLQWDLNEVWTGGISSYSLILMCVSFMKDCTKKKLDISKNLGYTLLLFLEMYGRNFNYSNTGIRTVSDISYVPKDEIMKNMDGTQWSSILCIEDPLNPGNDIGRSSYGALHVKLAFDYAYRNLAPLVLSQSSHLYEDQISILGRIIRITPEVIKYRAFIKKKYGSQTRIMDNHGCMNRELQHQGQINNGSEDTNTNNSNQKSKCNNIGEKGDVPNGPAIAPDVTKTTIKPITNNYKKSLMDNLNRVPGQVRVSALNDVKTNNSNNGYITRTTGNSSPPSLIVNNSKITSSNGPADQVHSKHWKKPKSIVNVNGSIKRD